MNKFISFFLIFLLPLLINCKDNKDSKDKITKNEKNISAMNTDDKLKDGINISTSFIENLEFNKYKYNGEYIEQIKVSSFEDPSFKKQFFQYLISRNLDQNQFEQVFFIKLLLVRVQQVDDIRSYEILSSIFNDNKLSYYLEDYELYLFQLFLYKPYFFVKGEYKYKHNQLLDYINNNLPAAYLTNKEYLNKNIVEIEFQENTLLISEDVVNQFTILDLKNQIEKKSNKVEAFFSPSYDTNWQNKTRIYYNIYDYMNTTISDRLDKNELLLYNIKYMPFFKSYLIKGKIQYRIQDPDGYTNLRKENSISSEVLQKIKTGEQIEVLDNSGDWYLVRTSEGKQGYVHKSRVKND